MERSKRSKRSKRYRIIVITPVRLGREERSDEVPRSGIRDFHFVEDIQ
jgi:hypothetical protein